MAKPTKRKVPGGVAHAGRVTASGGPAGGGDTQAHVARSPSRSRPTASSRYTPPVPARLKGGPSARIVPIAMFTLLGMGVLMIVINYLSVLLPGAPSNWYIVGGLGLILAGIMVATQWR
jgi:Cell division protein CrgA